MAGAMGAAFGLSWLLAPREGILGRWRRLKASRKRFAAALVLEHLSHTPTTREALTHALAWPAGRVHEVLGYLDRRALLEHSAQGLRPAPKGLEFVRSVVG